MQNFLAIDLFAGAGGATQGLVNAGFKVIGAIENDADAAASYRVNHPCVKLVDSDIRMVAASKFRESLDLRPGQLTLLKACPPCQGFSTLAEGRTAVDGERNDLVMSVVRFARAFMPSSILVENVPGLRRDRRFATLVKSLETLGYAVRSYVVLATHFGVPQRRKRLIIIAIKGRRSEMPLTLGDQAVIPTTVGDAFSEIDAVDRAGDPLSVHRSIGPKVLARISSIPIGGDRFDLPKIHRLRCHEVLDATGAKTATSSYGRLKSDQPAPTMTTRCTTPACGSFIHPTENRGISLREAATLQTFPTDYKFVGKYGSIERQIGNAVPVLMAEKLGTEIRSILQTRRSNDAGFQQ